MSEPGGGAPQARAGGRLLPVPWDRAPWWALVLAIAGLALAAGVWGSPLYRATLVFLWDGVLLTLRLTLSAYALALAFGLIAGLMRISRRPLLETIGTVYVEVIRGVPLLVLLIYIAFVAAPVLSSLLAGAARGLGLTGVAALVTAVIRSDINRAVFGLAIGYGAYLAEVYRAGIEAVPRGQVEAARSLGLSGRQAMRFVVLPQAFRIILPPLGNELIALLKDSALASAIAVPELTQAGRLLSARTFRAFETYNMVAVLYLLMTLIGSAGVRLLERWTRAGR
jgi:polar amino acid transport system permease protein